MDSLKKPLNHRGFMETLEAQTKEAERLTGRPVEIVRTIHGKYVAEYFNYNSKPPPVADTPEEALEKFVEFIKENTNEIDDRAAGIDDTEDAGA
jgi:hypothetical protein